MPRTLAYTRRVAVLAAVLILCALCLSACSSSAESEQRKAFIAFLNTVLERQSPVVPELTRETRKTFEEYADQYGIIETFNKNMVTVIRDSTQVMGLKISDSVSDLMRQKDDIAASKKDVHALVQKLRKNLDTANSAKAALKQPEDVQKVYGTVFQKFVTRRGESALNAFSSMEKALSAASGLLDFIDSHSEDLEVSGRSVSVKNPAVESELLQHTTAITDATTELLNAHNDFRAAMRP